MGPSGAGPGTEAGGAAVNLVVDIAVVVILLASVLTGARSGLLASLGSLVGLLAGAWGSVWVVPLVTGQVAQGDRALAAIVTFGALLLAGCGIGAGIGAALGRLVDAPLLRAIGRICGAVLGLVTGLVLVVVGASALSSSSIPGLEKAIASSTVLHRIETALPDGVEDTLAEATAQLAEGLSIPQVIEGPTASASPTATDPPVDLEDPALRTAAQSVARISGEAPACSIESRGSGVVLGDDLVVTNAHVVAGVDHPSVTLPGRRAVAGRVIAYDEADDLAVISADVDAPALTLTDDLQPGDAAAIQGYPRGGPFRSRTARVISAGPAVMTDSQGSGTVRRSVYSLAATVVPGNSGGPLLTADGDVAGIVFAHDASREKVGYALQAKDVRELLDGLSASDRSVETRECTA